MIRYILAALLFAGPAFGQSVTQPPVTGTPGNIASFGAGGVAGDSGTALVSATPIIIKGGINPAVHLVNLEATATPTVCFVGDSTVSQGNYVAPIDSQLSKVEMAFQAKYPNKTFTFKDFSIGGQRLSDVTTVLTSGWPSWYTNHAATWWSYAGAAGCTVIYTNFGLNDTGYENAAGWVTYFTAVVSSYPNSSVDELISTNIVANPSATGYNSPQYQAGYLANAALQRNLGASSSVLGVSGLAPVGIVDIGRFFNMAVLGRDPVDQILTYAIQPSSPVVAGVTTTSTFYYTLGNTDGDFDLVLNMNNGAAMVGPSEIIIPLCANASGTGGSQGTSCFVGIYPNGGTAVYANVYYGQSGAPISGVSNNWSSTNNTIEVSVQAGHLFVTVNGQVIHNRWLPFTEGDMFTPEFSITGGVAGTTVTVNSYAFGTMKAYKPSITAANCYGSYPNGLDSGNGINHVASDCLNGVYAPVIEAALQPGAATPNFVAAPVSPLTGATVTLAAGASFTPITPAGTLAALTVTLPIAAPQGKPVQFSISQAITALTVAAPSGYTISGAGISAASSAANAVYSYVLEGTVFYRVQ